jgi:integrase
MNMRSKRRSSELIPILTPREIEDICLRAHSKRDACLVALLYMSGRRINEVLSLRKKDFNKIGNKLFFTTFNEKSFTERKTGNFTLDRYVDFKYRDGRKSEPHQGIKYYEKITPQVSLSSVSGMVLGRFITKHLDDLQPDDYLFSPHGLSSNKHIKQPRAYQIIRALDDRLWLHALRHMNFTRLAEAFKDDPVSMHEFTFHKRFESTLNYIHTKEAENRLETI